MMEFPESFSSGFIIVEDEPSVSSMLTRNRTVHVSFIFPNSFPTVWTFIEFEMGVVFIRSDIFRIRIFFDFIEIIPIDASNSDFLPRQISISRHPRYKIRIFGEMPTEDRRPSIVGHHNINSIYRWISNPI